MSTDLYNKLFGKDEEYVDEDENQKIIEEMENPDEIDAAIEVVSEKIEETVKESETSSNVKSEPSEKSSDEEGGEDTSDKDKTDAEKKAGEDTSKKDEIKSDGEHDDKSKTGEDGAGEFKLTNKVIESKPEDVRGILEKYKDKDRSEIAKAAASAIALKSPYTKDNQAVVDSIMKGFESKSDDELLDILIDTQKGTGLTEPRTVSKYESQEIDLPSLPQENEQLQNALNKEVLTRLKNKYPSMPDVETMDSPEFTEFVRDLNNDKPLNKLKQDMDNIEKEVGTELSKVIFIEQNLSNLYQDSPSEVLPLLTDEKYPRLKALNDEPMAVLVDDVKDEIKEIEEHLSHYGLKPEDIGVDFTIKEDDKGFPSNPILNELITLGKNPDGSLIPNNEIIGVHAATFWLNKGKLVEKFKEKYESKIITTFVANSSATDKVTKETLKDSTLREAGGSSSGGGKTSITEERIENEENPAELDKMIASLGGN